MTNVGHEKNGGKLTLEVTDVGIDVFGDILDGFGLDFGAEKLGFSAEDGAFIFKLRELEIESTSPGETGSKALVDGFDLRGETVASDDDLFVELVEVVKDIEELLLGFFLVDDELEIVDDEAVEFLEFAVEIFTFAAFDGVDEIRIEVGNWGIEDLVIGVFLD